MVTIIRGSNPRRIGYVEGEQCTRAAILRAWDACIRDPRRLAIVAKLGSRSLGGHKGLATIRPMGVWR